MRTTVNPECRICCPGMRTAFGLSDRWKLMYRPPVLMIRSASPKRKNIQYIFLKFGTDLYCLLRFLFYLTYIIFKNNYLFASSPINYFCVDWSNNCTRFRFSLALMARTIRVHSSCSRKQTTRIRWSRLEQCFAQWRVISFWRTEIRQFDFFLL